MLRYQIQPSFYDLDWMGIVSNLSYIRWLEDIRSRLLDISPYPMQRLMREKLSPALFTTHVDYISAYIGTQGGLIEVQVTAGDKMGRSRWELLYQFRHLPSGKHLANAMQLGCFVHLPEVRPARIPAEMIAFLEDKLAPHTDYPLAYITLTP
jgi:acyl-CoA thioester hydrolase